MEKYIIVEKELSRSVGVRKTTVLEGLFYCRKEAYDEVSRLRFVNQENAYELYRLELEDTNEPYAW